MRDTTSIATIRAKGRVWAVGAIHGECGRLAALHGELESRFEPRDALIYLGDYLGYGPDVSGVMSELIAFRRRILARPPLRFPDDIVYLRGRQEEMWQKLLQLQFASDPLNVLDWVLERGVDATVRAYGGDPEDGRRSARAGPMELNKWTMSLRDAVHRCAGHDTLVAALKRAAVKGDEKILFVNCGLDPKRPLELQRDAFWWAGHAFDTIDSAFDGFARVVRGYDPGHRGYAERPHTITVDGGCGFGGPLVAACLAADGAVIDRIEV